MATYYVDGTNGNDSYNGTAATFTSGSTGPKKTLSGAEAIPVAAGDTVYVRAGTYRETLTCGVSGTAGNPITYQGDYAGAIWAGGGVVRVTGSDDDRTATRANVIDGSGKGYRTFARLALDTSASNVVVLNAGGLTGGGWTLQDCAIVGGNSTNAVVQMWATSNNTLRRCWISGTGNGSGFCVQMFDGATLRDSTSNLVELCLLTAAASGIHTTRIGGVTVRNCVFNSSFVGVRVTQALNAGQTVTVNNCIFYAVGNAVYSDPATGCLLEDYNDFYGCATNRNNVAVGASSKTYPPLFDTRWFFQLVTAAAANQVVTPFDLSSASQLINLAGTSPTATDMRSTSAIGGTREWGALEYDSGLKFQGGGGGAVSISPLRGRLGG